MLCRGSARSIAVWFASNAVITLFNVTPYFLWTDTIISHLVTTVIYGRLRPSPGL